MKIILSILAVGLAALIAFGQQPATQVSDGTSSTRQNVPNITPEDPVSDHSDRSDQLREGLQQSFQGNGPTTNPNNPIDTSSELSPRSIIQQEPGYSPGGSKDLLKTFVKISNLETRTSNMEKRITYLTEQNKSLQEQIDLLSKACKVLNAKINKLQRKHQQLQGRNNE